MTDRSLYGIANEFAALEQLLDDIENGQIDDADAEVLQRWLSEMEGELEGKVDNVCGYIKELEGLAFAREYEAKRIEALAKQGRARVERLKRALFETLGAVGQSKVEGRRFRVSVVANGGKQALDYPEDPSLLPLVYRKTTTIVGPDTEKIRADIEAGIHVPGCSLLPRGKRLQIK